MNTQSIFHPVLYILLEACVYVPRVYVCWQRGFVHAQQAADDAFDSTFVCSRTVLLCSRSQL
jgi:hypothetical protein